jgi:hypothetical protein
MKALAAVVFLACTGPGAVWLQAQSAPAPEVPASTVPSPTLPSEGEQTDRWPALKDEAQRLRHVWDKTHTESMAEVDKLLRSKVCQINRIGSAVDRAQKALNDYFIVAKKYWEVWSKAETQRVDDLKKAVQSMEVDEERAKAILEDEKKNRETLDQKEALLDQSTRTEAVRKEIDLVKQGIHESEDSLNIARDRLHSVSIAVTNMNDDIIAQVIDINQHSARLEAWSLGQTSVYDDKLKEANAVCGTKRHGTLQTPQKGTANP